jgi:hypothetical protein
MTEDEKRERIKKMLSCDICKQYLALSMFQPLRCPGLSYNEKGEQVTGSGKLWSEIVKEHEEAHAKELQEFREKYSQHMKEHLK